MLIIIEELWDVTDTPCSKHANDSFDKAEKCIGLRLSRMLEQHDAADVPRDFHTLSCLEQLSQQHGYQNADPHTHHTGRHDVSHSGATTRSDNSGPNPAQAQLPTG